MNPMEALKIILLCMSVAVLFGILHDQVTARICVEYFTIGHPRVIASESPTMLAFVWGVLATWWVGLLLGVPLALASRLGSQAKRSARSLLRPLAKLVSVMAVGSLTFGMLGYLLARQGVVELQDPIASRISPERHVLFLADLWAHSASYLFAFGGGIVLIWRTHKSRATK
ncbi:MAG: hypothetical protein ACI9F9_001076 [Candidatus Paceibacteria bacterium]|jgi:hypothetical protein